MLSTTDLISIIHDWQELIGSAMGPFLAIILSAISFWIRSKYLSRKERKEAIRQTEVSVTRSLHDMYRTREEVIYFLERLRSLVQSVKDIKDETTYMIEEINFPHLKDVFTDSTLPILGFKSYYLHNKLLLGDAGITATNSMLKGLKETFTTIIANNKFLIALRERPRAQRNSYVENLGGFVNVVDTDVLLSINNGIRALMEIKAYNLKLMRHSLTVWKYEGRSFKFFINLLEFRKYSGNPDAIDKLDKKFEKEVQELLIQANGRGKKLDKGKDL